MSYIFQYTMGRPRTNAANTASAVKKSQLPQIIHNSPLVRESTECSSSNTEGPILTQTQTSITGDEDRAKSGVDKEEELTWAQAPPISLEKSPSRGSQSALANSSFSISSSTPHQASKQINTPLSNLRRSPRGSQTNEVSNEEPKESSALSSNATSSNLEIVIEERGAEDEENTNVEDARGSANSYSYRQGDFLSRLEKQIQNLRPIFVFRHFFFSAEPFFSYDKKVRPIFFFDTFFFRPNLFFLIFLLFFSSFLLF